MTAVSSQCFVAAMMSSAVVIMSFASNQVVRRAFRAGGGPPIAVGPGVLMKKSAMEFQRRTQS
jgi:hypothetical protein